MTEIANAIDNGAGMIHIILYRKCTGNDLQETGTSIDITGLDIEGTERRSFPNRGLQVVIRGYVLQDVVDEIIRDVRAGQMRGDAGDFTWQRGWKF